MGFCKSGRLAMLSVTLLVAACGESGGPSEFNPSGMAADLALFDGVESDETFSALTAAFDDMASATGGSGTVVATAGLFLREPRSTQSTEQVPTVMRSLVREQRLHGPTFSRVIPPEVAGTTFEYDPAAGHWVAGDRTGAPANGVRFILYAVDGTGAVLEPLEEIGYADLSDLSSGSRNAGRIVVVANGTTHVDYAASFEGDATDAQLELDGFINFGTDRMVFDFGASYAGSDETTSTFSLDSDVSFPEHDVHVSVAMTGSSNGDDGSIELTETIESPNGRIDLAGAWATGASPSVEIEVNGEPYAHLAGYSEGQLVGVDGRELTAQEKQVLLEAFLFADIVAIVPVFLLSPMAGWMAI